MEHSRLVARRDPVHGRVLPGQSEADVRQGRFAGGPRQAVQRELDGNARRAIDIHEGERVDADAFKALIRAAVALNASDAKAKPKRAKPAK